MTVSRERPDFLETLADQQAQDLTTEITGLEDKAAQLAAEIESLTGVAPFGEE